ncbi:hypothetical protein F5Y07DRAFT_262446 [Xylaria sp. FL0933]|nr:hypothetical protein F5Y07DRAFT_262446 [Xylaria sp. FL0933]
MSSYALTGTQPAMISSLGAGSIAISVIFPVAAVVSAILRLRARRSATLSWTVDDYMIMVALLSVISYAIIDIIAVAKYSFGTHVIFLPVLSILGILKLWFANGLVMIASSTFAKLSIAYFYRRVLPPYRSSKSTLILLVIVYAWGIAYLAASLFSCIPVSKRWDPTNVGSCYPTDQENEAFDIANLAISVILLLRPVTQVREFRQLPSRAKALIGTAISLGVVVIAVMITRVATSHYSEAILDLSYDLAKLGILAEVEDSILVICACIISLVSYRPLNDVEGNPLKNQGIERFEKPELAAEHIPRQFHELDSNAIAEMPVVPPELVGTEQRHEADDTSMPRQ